MKRYGDQAIEKIIESLKCAEPICAGTSNPISYKNSELQSEDIEAILMSIVEFKPDVKTIDKKQIIIRSVFNTISQPNLTTEMLLSEIEKEEQKFRRKRKKKYVLTTYISIDNTCHFIKRKKWKDAVITFSQQLPKTFNYGELIPTIHSLQLNPPQNWMAVRVSALGRTPEEAFYSATESLETIRAIWNFRENVVLIHQTNSPTDKPVNKFRLGPFQSIHHPNGSLASRYFWYQQPYLATDYPGTPYRFSKNEWQQKQKYERRFRNSINKIPYQEQFIEILREYNSSLDRPDVENNFLRLWTMLENLTGINEDPKLQYDSLIQRASFIWRERKTTKIILEHLRQARNNFVHQSVSHEEIRTCFYQLLWIVNKLIEFHFHSAGKFKSIEELGHFLQLTKDETTLKRHIKLRQYALNFG